MAIFGTESDANPNVILDVAHHGESTLSAEQRGGIKKRDGDSPREAAIQQPPSPNSQISESIRSYKADLETITSAVQLASEKFVMSEDDQSLHVPNRQLSQSFRSTSIGSHITDPSAPERLPQKFMMEEGDDDCLQPPIRRTSAQSTITNLSVASPLSSSARFFSPKCIQPPKVPRRDLNQSLRISFMDDSFRSSSHHNVKEENEVESADNLNSSLSASERFVTTASDQPLHVPSHPLDQSLKISLIDQSIRSCTLHDIVEETGKTVVTTSTTSTTQSESLRDSKPFPLPSNKDFAKAKSYADQLAMSARFSMAEFEEPLNVPNRQLSQSIRTDTLDFISDSFRSLGAYGDSL